MMIAESTTSLLEIANLSVEHRATIGTTPILHNVSATLEKGQILGVIGESGAGKSTLGNAVLGMLGRQFKQTSGTIRLAGEQLLGVEARGHTHNAGRRISAIFQDHTASLDPLMTIGAQLGETIRVSDLGLSRREVRARGIDLLERVGIPEPERRFNEIGRAHV